MFRMSIPKAIGLLVLTILALSAATFVRPERTGEMKVAVFEPPQGFLPRRILNPWMERVNPQLSSGHSFKLYAGGVLGSAAAQRELVRWGVIDVAVVVPFYTPGLFPGSNVVELPGLVSSSAEGTDLLNTLYEEDYLKDEYKDFKVIALYSVPPLRVLMRDKDVVLPQDLKGLRIRTSSPFGSTLLGMLGVTGTVIPVNQIHENLERGVVDGMVWTLDGYDTFQFYELAPRITMIKFTAAPMVILMNKDRYASLSAADRAVIDATSGREFARQIADIYDQNNAEIIAKFRSQEGVTVIDLDADQEKVWADAFKDAPDAWIDALPEGFDGQSLLDRARAIEDAR